MIQINIAEQEPSIRQFLESLAASREDTHVQVNGKTMLRILPPNLLDEHEARSLLEKRRELMCRARERSRDMSTSEIDSFIQEAIDEVRSKTKTNRND
jgi:hypothetical protein